MKWIFENKYYKVNDNWGDKIHFLIFVIGVILAILVGIEVNLFG